MYFKSTLQVRDPSQSCRSHEFSPPSLHQEDEEANASFEDGEVVNSAHAYDGKIILLFEMDVTHGRAAFQCRRNGEVSHNCLHEPHPHAKSRLSCVSWRISVHAARANTIVHRYETAVKRKCSGTHGRHETNLSSELLANIS